MTFPSGLSIFKKLLLIKTKKTEHIIPVLRSRHCCTPACKRMEFKVLLLVYESVSGSGPKYISDCLLSYEPSEPHVIRLLFPERKLNMEKQHLVYWAPQNKISEEIRLAPALTTFKPRLKTFLLGTAFDCTLKTINQLEHPVFISLF